MFQGFSQASVDYLWQIRFNNERPWFQEHKQEYLDLLDRPLRELGGQVQGELARRHPRLGLNLHVSRIYRDARRLHGKGPYKDHLWFVLHRPGDEEGRVPAFYFEIAPEYYSTGMGFYSATPMTMAKLRARMDRDPAPMEKLARSLNRQHRFVLEGESFRRPKGEKGPLLDPWYNRKSITLAWDRPCGGSLFTPELEGEILEGVEYLLPFYRYLSTVDGDPEPGM